MGEHPSVKLAYNYDYTPSGPNQRIKWNYEQADEGNSPSSAYPFVRIPGRWLDEFKQNLPRYGPFEYERGPKSDNGEGFYWAWPPDWNGPELWTDDKDEWDKRDDYPHRHIKT
jgi:hypothetical protein